MMAVGAWGARWQGEATPLSCGGVAAPAGSADTAQRGYPVGDGTFAATVRGTAPQPERDLQFAMMANDAYASNATGPTGTQSERELAAAGWQRLTPVGDQLVDAQGHPIPIDLGMLHDAKTGFDAAIYQNAQGQYVVAYRGTDNWSPGVGGDTRANLGQGAGLAIDQYESALALAERADKVFGAGNVAVSGHSLGGGLAAAAMLSVGAPGVTFNAAGLSDNTLRRLELGASANAVRADTAASGEIRRYNVEGELLTGIQQGPPLPDAVGHELRIAPASGNRHSNPVELHGGGGDQASYVEALRDNTAYRPGAPMPGAQLLERYYESRLNTLASFGTHLADAGRHAGQVAQDTALAVAEVAHTDLAQGHAAPAALRVGGALTDAALDIGAGAAENAADYMGDQVMEAGTLAGNVVRTAGAAMGLGQQSAALAVRLESAGQRANQLIDQAGQLAARGLDRAGDHLSWAADRAADGVRWATEQAVEGAEWAADKVAQGAEWVGDRLSDVGRWVGRWNPFGGA